MVCRLQRGSLHHGIWLDTPHAEGHGRRVSGDVGNLVLKFVRRARRHLDDPVVLHDRV